MSRAEKERVKAIQEKCQSILGQLLKDEDNKYCVDCDAKGPRWASWNLGVFLCIRCAGIHRNLGVHISRVKSVNLDSWTAEQVGSLQQMGNSKGRAVYEANLPDNFRRPTSDSSLEVFIRAKYEHKKYIAKEWVPQSIKPAFSEEEIRKKKEERRKMKTGAPIAIPPSSVARPKIAPGDAPGNVQNIPIISTNQQEQKPACNNDLLGLDTSNQSSNHDDMFGLFVAGPSPVKTGDLSPKNISVANPAEVNQHQPVEHQSSGNIPLSDNSFFKQTTESEPKKMSNESILSLFGNAGNTTAGNNPHQMFGVPGCMYVGQQPGMNLSQVPHPNPAMMMNHPGYSNMANIPNGIVGSPNNMINPSASFQQSCQQQQQPSMMMGPNPYAGSTAPLSSVQLGGSMSVQNTNPSIPGGQMFLANNIQQQNSLFEPTNDLMAWNSEKINRFASNTPHHQLHQQMASLQVGQQAQGWNAMNKVPDQLISQPTAHNAWMSQTNAMGSMPGQGQTLSNNLWK